MRVKNGLREKQILDLLKGNTAGMSRREIADKIGITKDNAKTHMYSMEKKHLIKQVRQEIRKNERGGINNTAIYVAI